MRTDKFEVFKTVIVPHPVAVVHLLTSEKGTPKVLLHHIPMLEDASS
jgi:hypothetical protein